MAEPWDSLLLLFPDNDQGLITAQAMRSQVEILEDQDNLNTKTADLPTAIEPALDDNLVPRWKGVVGTAGTQYYTLDMVRDGEWLMMANKDTTDRPSPQPSGSPHWFYTGAGGVENIHNGGQVVVGNRYVAQGEGYITGYRIDVVAGQKYQLLTVIDPLGAQEANFVGEFVAEVSGWREFGVVPILVNEGFTIDLLAAITNPDPAPTQFAGPWEYNTPQNATPPPIGNITHGGSTPNVISINKTDNNSADRSVDMATLVTGDTIVLDTSTWTIQAATDQGAYIDFSVVPAVQHSVAGVATVTFNTHLPTDIVYHSDPGYWNSTPNVQGLYVEDQTWENVVPDENAYGTDLHVQDATISEDWDVMAVTSGIGGVGADIFGTMTYDYEKITGFTVPSTTFSEVARLNTPERTAGVYEVKMSWTSTLDSAVNSQHFRFSIDGGATWHDFSIEPSDVTDTYPYAYFFPLEFDGGEFELIFQAHKDLNGDVMIIDFLDLIFQRVN